MVGILLVAIGAASMCLGVAVYLAWSGGASRWVDPAVYDRPSVTKTDRQYLDLYFAGLVVVPLLAGGLLIALGLQRVIGPF
jgi:hypothetical protein